MQEFKMQKIKDILKKQLKRKGLTYEMLAEELGCSVPTVARMMSAEEIGLSRLLQICDVLGLDFEDLGVLLKESSADEEAPEYTLPQSTFLAKNKNFFAYLMQLYAGKTPKQIAAEHNLSARSTDKYLIGLEKHELIRVTGKQKVRPAYDRLPVFGKGPLATVYFESFIRTGADFFIETIRRATRKDSSQEESEKCLFGISVLEMTPSSFSTWSKQLEQSLRDLERLADFEKKTKDPAELKSIILMNARALVDLNHPQIKAFENVMGEIVNL